MQYEFVSAVTFISTFVRRSGVSSRAVTCSTVVVIILGGSSGSRLNAGFSLKYVEGSFLLVPD